MRIDGRVVQRTVHGGLELFAQDVLELLRLGVHLMPSHPHLLVQIELEEAVMPDDLERHLHPAPGQGDPFVALVGKESHLAELFGHARDGRRRNVHFAGDGVRRDGRGLLLKLVNILQIVLHLLAQIGGAVQKKPHSRRGGRRAVRTIMVGNAPINCQQRYFSGNQTPMVSRRKTPPRSAIACA